MEIRQRREPTEVRKMTAKTCCPTEAGLTNARSQHSLWLLWEFRAKYTHAIDCNCTESCTKVSHRPLPSCAWS